MLTSKKVILITLMCALSICSIAQSIKVKKETSRINGENTEGFRTGANGWGSDCFNA